MFFRNLTLFRFPELPRRALSAFDKHLADHRLRPCGPIEMATQGFVSPVGRDSEELTHRVGKNTLFCLGGEDKLLPSSVAHCR